MTFWALSTLAASAPEAQSTSSPTNQPAASDAGAQPGPAGQPGLQLNFRGVPLEMVLNYLSDAAGFIIVPEVDVKGSVDVWSNQPLNRDEAVDVLNAVLSKNGYAAIRNGQTLKITTQEDARRKDLPVKVGNDPAAIPKNAEMVTQIIPVRRVNATQLTKDLQPLLPPYANLTANESGNALVLTDTQASVRRMTEIVKALDTSLSTVSTIHVFPLRHADAKELANEVKEVFALTSASNQGGNTGRGGGQLFQMFGGGPGGGGAPNGPGDGTGDGAGGTGNGAAGGGANLRVVAVADERGNSLVVSAPADMMETIKTMVEQVDTPVADITELRVFHLFNADPVELADLFSQLFPDQTKTADRGQNQGFRFGAFGGGTGGGPSNSQDGSSARMKKLSRVMVVADQRTSSVIVSGPATLMPQIEAMVHQLDSSSAKKQKVYVYSLESADVQRLVPILQDMFQRNNTSMNRNTANDTSALITRSEETPTASQNSTGVGNSGAPGGGGLGNTGPGNSGATGR